MESYSWDDEGDGERAEEAQLCKSIWKRLALLWIIKRQNTPDGIEITCPNVMGRVKPTYMDVRRKDRSAMALPHDLTTMIGDGLSRVCPLDMALGANQLQAVQQTARVQDLVQANKLLSLALALGGLKGIKYVA